MNSLQPEKFDDEFRFEDILVETAWGEVETTFRSSGMVAPLPGFTNRWMQRLELARQKEERKHRITSYNVCYTKLLRSGPAPHRSGPAR